MKKILVTGGAGFAGSNIAIAFKQRFDAHVIAFDNLKRRGSELTLARLRENGIEFMHGDIRCAEDFSTINACDLLIECAAEPSVLAGRDGSPGYVINTNLNGTINCLEVARKTGATLIFLSTSRVYPFKKLGEIKLQETETRYEISANQDIVGVSPVGISETFPLEGARTIYGATKLASELLVQEYIDTYGLRAVINRCGVLSGPWQMGKIDQGVVVLWAAKHIYGGDLGYIGFGGSGKQVRDVLHIQDLIDLLLIQTDSIERISAEVFNVGGGMEVSASLREMTDLCTKLTGNQIKIKASTDNRPGDIPIYVTDNSKINASVGWAPKRSLTVCMTEIIKWISDNKEALRPILS